jgi:hypothetical protein
MTTLYPPSKARERLPFRPSPDKGVERGIRGALRRACGTGRLCKGGPAGQEGFAAVKWAWGGFTAAPPPHSPLVRGEAGKRPLSSPSLQRLHATALEI